MRDEEGGYKQEMVPITLGNLEDADGKSADAYLVERLMEMESHIKDYRRSHAGRASDKPYEITLKVMVLPDETGNNRVAEWKMEDLKTPKMARSHRQICVSRDGVIHAAMDKQEKMNFAVPSDEETGER